MRILSSADTQAHRRDLRQHLTLRVTYADGSTADVQCDVRGYGLRLVVGQEVPVLVSAGDRTSVEVDVEGIKATHQAEAAAGQQWNRDLGELQRKREAGEVSEAEWQAEAERMLFEDD